MNTLTIDFQKGVQDVLVDLIRLSNEDEPLDPGWIQFDEPVSRTPSPDVPRNTSIYARSVSQTPLTGNRTFFYNRVAINDFLFDGLVTEDDLTVVVTAQLNTVDLQPAIAEILDIHPEHVGLINIPLPLITDVPVPWVVTWLPTHSTIQGSLTLWLMR